jgi:hypothetical protein
VNAARRPVSIIPLAGIRLEEAKSVSMEAPSALNKIADRISKVSISMSDQHARRLSELLLQSYDPRSAGHMGALSH